MNWTIHKPDGTSYTAYYISGLAYAPHEVSFYGTIAGITTTHVLYDTDFDEIEAP